MRNVHFFFSRSLDLVESFLLVRDMERGEEGTDGEERTKWSTGRRVSSEVGSSRSFALALSDSSQGQNHLR